MYENILYFKLEILKLIKTTKHNKITKTLTKIKNTIQKKS